MSSESPKVYLKPSNPGLATDRHPFLPAWTIGS